ncbi:hypothetical protein BaRGS_00012216 [Batillaria attramentaria]|uniref:Uncharacterized protein n=1 Tax=Batillaria attramentaria TaxID=370345 RepID=A0ABD0LAY7_9CAEN
MEVHTTQRKYILLTNIIVSTHVTNNTGESLSGKVLQGKSPGDTRACQEKTRKGAGQEQVHSGVTVPNPSTLCVASPTGDSGLGSSPLPASRSVQHYKTRG